MLRKSRQSAPIFVNIDAPDSSETYYDIGDTDSPLEKYKSAIGSKCHVQGNPTPLEKRRSSNHKP